VILAEHVIVPDAGRVRVYPIGDLHVTLRTHQRNRLTRYLRTIMDDPAGVAFIMGDVTDARSREHRFFAPEMIHPRYNLDSIDRIEQVAAEEVAELLEPLVSAGKLGGLLQGNHHAAYFTHALRSLLALRSGADPSGFPNLGDRAMVRLKVLRPDNTQLYSVIVFLTHVDSGSRKPGAQLNRQLDTQTAFGADLYLYAHSHRGSVQVPQRWSLSRTGRLRAVQQTPVHVNAGAFLEPMVIGATSYADSKNLPPQDDTIRFVEFRLVKGERGVKELRGKPVVWDG
jgi:hypothetical protein